MDQKNTTEKSKKKKKIKIPFDVIVPSSYCLTKITSTKSRGDITPIAAEDVTVLHTVTS